MPIDNKKEDVKFTGYPIKTVRELLGIKKETFRYWRSNLDPNPFRASFMPSDILVYRIIKLLIRKRRLRVKELSNYDLSDIFKFCEITSYKKLKEYTVVLDDENNSLSLVGPDKTIDFTNFDLQTLSLYKVIEDHINEFSKPRARAKTHNIINLKNLRSI